MAPIARPSKGNHGDFQWHELKYNGLTLKYNLAYWGKQPPEGYPLFIGLHGGGSEQFSFDANNIPQWNGRGNDGRWVGFVYSYYALPTKAMALAEGGKSGAAHVAIRGLSNLNDQGKFEDSYNLHSRPESYVLYDQLLKNLFAKTPKELEATGFPEYSGTLNASATSFVNSNRVYLLGHSAGGDGVFNLARGMPDAFAGAVASAGYASDANGARSFFENFANLPLLLQVGEKDDAYFQPDEFGRAGRAKFYYHYNSTLNQLQKQNRPDGYPHDCFIIKNGTHVEWLNKLVTDSQYNIDFPTLPNLDDWFCDSTYPASTQQQPVQAKQNAVAWAQDKIRRTTPSTVIWNLGQRPPYIGDKRYDNAVWEQRRFHYWLFDRKPAATKNMGHTVRIRWEKGADNNTKIFIDEIHDWLGILLREPMVVFGNRVTIQWRAQTQAFTLPAANARIKQETLDARGDEAMAFGAMIYFESGWTGTAPNRQFFWNVKLAESLDAGGGEKLLGRLVPDNVSTPRL